MSKEQVISAIDLGSDKIVTLIATIDSNSREMRVVGSSSVPSAGIIKNVIVNLEEALGAVEKSINAAERMAGFSVHRAFVSLSGEHIQSQNSTGVVAVANPEIEITKSDVDRVIEAARAVSISPDKEIIHIIPRYFKVDSQAGIRDPTHMTGVRLEAEAHLIIGSSTSIKNIQKCLNDLGIEIAGFVFSALSSSEVSLTETEKELGVVLCDIGVSTSSFCVYVDGALSYSGSIPIGARHITQDIALGCKIEREIAEKIKVHICDSTIDKIKPLPGETKKDFMLRKEKADKLDISSLGQGIVDEELSKSFIINRVMYPRIQEIVVQLGAALEKEQLLTSVPAGVVYSGGGALTIDLIEISERVLGLPARIAQPNQPLGLIAETSSTILATALGLLVRGKTAGIGETISHKIDLKETIKDLKINELGKTILKIVKKALP